MTKNICTRDFSPLILAAILTLAISAPLVHAHVYPTGVRINGSVEDVIVGPGTGVTISYFLNEAATAGVEVRIQSGTEVVRSLSLAGGAAGTQKGANQVLWDGKDGQGAALPYGVYQVQVTAAATGYADWTQLNSDASPSSYVWDPRGIAVNQNQQSPYYGRILVANAGPGPGSSPGDRVGVLRLNSDGSFAAEGALAQVPQDFSPWKIEVGPDDRVYINDFAAHGVVMSFDQAFDAGARRYVLRQDNWPHASADLNGPLLTTSGGTNYIWMADTATAGAGIRRWELQPDGTVSTNDSGITVVAAGAGSDLNLAPYDLTADPSNRVYTTQYITTRENPNHRLFRFPAYDESGVAITNADWEVGAGDNLMAGAGAVAASPDGEVLAVAFRGTFAVPFGPWHNGSVALFASSNGMHLTTVLPATVPSHEYYDLAWDRAGNLYVVDAYDTVWRMFSPPGPNASTTPAIAQIQVASSVPFMLTNAVLKTGSLEFTLVGEPAATYVIQESENFLNWTPVLTNQAPEASRLIDVPLQPGNRFYRAFRWPLN